MGNGSSTTQKPPVATITSGANTSNPTIVLNSIGTFNIVATASSSVNYTGTTLTSLPITVYPDVHDIEFSPLLNTTYTYTYGNPIEITGGAASIKNNTGQTLIYSIVTVDSTINSLTPSTVATIDRTGYSLTTVSCGTTGTSTFKICAIADATPNGDFGPNIALSETLTIVKATPTILQYPQINLPTGVTPSTLVYKQQYTISPDPVQISIITSNTDTNPYPSINYTSSDKTVAIITGTMVTIVGIGNFQIWTTVGSTINYNQIFQSPSLTIYETVQAVPTITSFPTIPKILGYGSSYVIPPTIITDNTDILGPLITYESNNNNIANIHGNTIIATGVVPGTGKGSYQIFVTIHATINFSTKTYTYPSPTTYYTTEWIIPIITFLLPPTFVTSSRYGSTYNFVAPILSNNDPSQSLTYSIIDSNPVSPSVASLQYQTGVQNPSVVINSVGTFKIQARCLESTNGFYSYAVNTSPTITISKEIPIIVFDTANFNSSYSYQPTTSYPLTPPIASITNNTAQSLTYSIVDTDGVTPSTIATITSDGTSLTTNSVGSFQILAIATATLNSDYGPGGKASETITVVSVTPTVITFPILPSTFIYGNSYTIPYTAIPPYTITTSNIDIPGPTITYSSSNQQVATISGSVTCSTNSAISNITGTTITIIGIGNFQISVTIGATTNYNQAVYVLYPSPTTYYTSIQATPTITFPSNFGSGWVIGGTYNLTSTVTTNTGSGYTDTNTVNYSIVINNNKVNMIARGIGDSSGVSAYSTDGMNWISNSSIPMLNCVAWNGNIWLGGASYSATPIFFSVNGINWFPANYVPVNYVNGIAWNGTIWVAIGGGANAIVYSSDGINWTGSNISTTIISNGSGIAWNGEIWVAVGQGISGYLTDNTIAYSSDGINWNASNNSTNIFPIYAKDIAWNGSIWVAVGNSLGNGTYSMAYSTDGINWTGSNNSTTIFSNYVNGIAWNGKIWVAVGSGANSIAYSTDGINWTGSNNSTTIFSNGGSGITWNGEIWVAVGNGTNSIAYSTDGINWTGYNNTTNIFTYASIIDSAVLVPNTATSPKPIIVALSNATLAGSSTIYYSNDGMNWSPAYGVNSSNNSNTIFSSWGAGVAWNGSMFVAVGSGTNTIAYSINGQYWYPSNNSMNIFSYGQAVAWNGSLWVAVGTGTNTIAYSPDGINWTGSNNSTTIFSSGIGIAWNGEIWVAVGEGTNSIAYSPDGINWTGSNNSTTIFSNGGSGIAWNGEIWVAVGSGANSIAWSTDGINWTGSNNSTTIFSSSSDGGTSVAWNGSMWVAVGNGSVTNNTIAYSYDGKEWTGVGNSIFSLSGNGVTWYVAYNMWVVTGRGSYDIGYSKDGINWYPVNNSANIFTGTDSFGMAVASTSSVIFYTNNIATINTSGSQISINDIGTFKIQASLAATSNFLPTLLVESNTITIVAGNVSLLSNNFSNFVYNGNGNGGQYNLQVTTNNIDTNPAPNISYTITTPSGSTGSGSINGNLLTVISAGSVCITVNITATQNFNAATIPVYVNIAQATQTIVLNPNGISSNMYVGSQFECYNLVVPSQSNNPSPSYSYTVVLTSTIGGNYYPTLFGYGSVATIDSNNNLICVSPGAFTINVTAAATTNFSQTTVSTSTIYVSIVPEVIIFNNPQTFPPSPYLGGEVGMAINIPYMNYPFGFQNYSALTITNTSNGATFTLNAQTTPTFNVPALGNANNVMNKYLVFFEPATAGSFSGALTPSQATGYIEYVGINSIANGIASGQELVFTFSGNTNTSAAMGAAAGPDPLIINWNPGSLNITPGLVYGAYFTLGNPTIAFVSGYTPNVPNGTGVTISTLNSGGITGYYIAPWAGYNTSSITGGIVSYIGLQNLPYYSYVTQAWGVWAYYQTTNTYQIYPPTTSQTINGTTYYYYVGIPQMNLPLQFTNYYQLYG
jgi:hypothetical protein